MSRRSHFVQVLTVIAFFLWAAISTAHIAIGRSSAVCLLAVGVGVVGGTLLGFILDEYRPPRPGWWRAGWRR
jgi:hypothetical protein